MNWHYIRTLAPGGYRQFQHWILEQLESNLRTPAQVRQRSYQPWLYDFFEKQGIVVNVIGGIVYGELTYGYDLQENNTLNGVLGDGYATRLEAEAAAFCHAFALLDKRKR